GQDARAEPEPAGVGDADGVGFILGGDDRRDRPEHFLVVRRLAGEYVGQYRCRVPGAGPVRDLAAEQEPRALADAFVHLAMDFVARLDALHRPEPGALAPRIADV